MSAKPETEPTAQSEWYIVGVIEKDLDVQTPWGRRTAFLKWADGMVGACPVFKDKASAEAYAAGKYRVWRITKDGK